MRKSVSVCSVLAALALLAVPLAPAASSAVVRLPACVFGSGERTVPAGSDVTVAAAWLSMARAGVTQFVDAVEVTATVDGTAVPDANSYFGPITHNLVPSGTSGPALPSWWGTEWAYGVGTLENPGDQVVVSTSWNLTRPVLEVNLALSPPASFIGPGEIFGGTCTITAT